MFFSSENVYVQIRRFCAPKVRFIQTRDMTGSHSSKTDIKLPFPVHSDQTISWEPNDSVHRGKLYLRGTIGGEPTHQEFGPGENNEHGPFEWCASFEKVWCDLKANYKSSNCFLWAKDRRMGRVDE